MQVTFQTPGQWADLNERLTEVFPGLPGNSEVRAYTSVGSALVEIALGFAKMYPLKKKVAYIKDQDPNFEYPLTLLAREGYQLVPISLNDLANPDIWFSQLDRETLFLLYADSDPLLGICWPIAALEDKCKDSSFQKIRVTHVARAPAEKVNWVRDRNSTTISGLPSGGALAFAGERARLMGLVMPTDSWDRSAWLKTAKDFQAIDRTEDAVAIEKFEQKSVAGARAVFSIEGLKWPRHFDRAAIYWPDIDGAAVMDRLEQRLGQGKILGRIETTSLTRWGGVRTMDWLKSFGLSAEIIRGLLLVDVGLLNAEFEASLIEVCRSIRKDQAGQDTPGVFA